MSSIQTRKLKNIANIIIISLEANDIHEEHIEQNLWDIIDYITLT